jgi:hypothetical protein
MFVFYLVNRLVDFEQGIKCLPEIQSLWLGPDEPLFAVAGK